MRLLSILLPILITALLLASGLAVVLFLRRRSGASDSHETMRQRAAGGLRRRLRIRREDGFVVGSEKPLRRGFWCFSWLGSQERGGETVVIRRQAMEAAARLAMWEDFDVRAMDAFCESLQVSWSNVFVRDAKGGC
jgi:hypothetical protein